MEWLEEKYEIVVAAILVIIICACIWVYAHFDHVREVRAQQEISFEMPRPKTLMASFFDLIGREIDRQFVNPFVIPEAGKKSNSTAPSPLPPPSNRVAEALKKADDKKKKASMKVDVVDTGRKGGLSLTDDSISNSPVQVYEPAVRNVATKKEVAKEEVPADKSDRLSPDQWRALISAQPTQANVNKLIEAYQTRELDSGSFYQIVRDLWKNTKVESQTLGIYALKMTPSASSFSELVHSLEVTDTSLHASVNQALASYGSSSAFIPVLGVQIQSKDVPVALKAMEIVNTNISALKNQLAGKDQKSTDPEIVKLMAQWKAYVAMTANLKQVSGGADQQLSSIANSILAVLQG